MSAYVSLATYYDALTQDVPYGRFVDFYEDIFCRYGICPGLVLDLACGTGTITLLMAEKGYEMIGVDASEDMLAAAMEKVAGAKCDVCPMFLCQSMEELDLYGTVSAAICSLDGINYVPPASLSQVFQRLRLFLEPGGVFVFDVNTPEKLKGQDGQLYIDETDNVYCVWRTEFDFEENVCNYGIDIFMRRGGLWQRGFEEHTEYAHSIRDLKQQLEKSGFGDISVFGELRPESPSEGERRVFLAARRL